MKLLAPLLMTAALAAPAFSAAAADSAPGPDLAKGQASYAAVCVACHGEAGQSTLLDNPVLAQQHPAYMVKQLKDFKDGKRVDIIMKGFADMLSEEEMVNISAWLGQQKAQPGFATDKDLVALGERIYRGGLQDRNIAACAGCHSPSGAGIPAQYPRLSGQHAQYTIKQLKEFRDGTRPSPEMRDVSAKLNDREIQALADYIAGLR